MNLGAGLAAADGFFKTREHLEDRDYQQKQRDYQSQLMNAGLETLPDQTAADRARLQLSAGTSSAGLQTLPGQTANTLKQQGLDSAGLDFKTQQQPIEQSIAADKNTVAEAQGKEAVHNIPFDRAMRQARQIPDAQQARLQLIAGLTGALQTNDPAIVKDYFQKSFETGLFPPMAGKKVGDVQMNGDTLVVKDDQGADLFSIRQQDLNRIVASQSAPTTVKDGDILVKPDGQGGVTKVFENTKDSRAAGGNASEMEKQYKFLTLDPQGPRIPAEEAKQMIMKGSHKTPEERYNMFQMELVKAAAGLGKAPDPKAIAAQATALSGYSPSNSGGTPTIDPKIQDLISSP